MIAPILAIFCGPNGSGKTTLTKEIVRQGVQLGRYINPDDIAAKISGSDEFRSKEAQRRADEERERCLIEGCNFAFETVFSHPAKLHFMDRASAAGYQIHVFFVSLPSPKMNVERVRLRAESGGHDVPTERIIARWARTMAMLPEIAQRADRLMVFDNGTPPDAPIIRLIAHGTRNENGTLDLLRDPNAPQWLNTYLPVSSTQRHEPISPARPTR